MDAGASKWDIFKKWLLENLPWLFVIFGIISLLMGYNKMLPQNGADNILNNLPEALKTIGTTVLGAGIFAAILKSFQFTGIFQKAVAQVIYSSDYLRKQDRKYLENTWRQVSQALFTSKFPKVKDDMEAVMLKSYFPIDHNYYYESLQVSYSDLELTEENGEPFISFEQHIKANIIPLEKNGDFIWYSKYEGKDAIRNIIELSITRDDDEPSNLKSEIEASKDSNYFEKKFPCKCQKYYKLVKSEKRKLPMAKPTNDQLELCLTRVTSGLTVFVSNYDTKRLKISFVNKTIEEFKPLPMEVKGNLALAREYTGIILPTHGFCLVLSKI